VLPARDPICEREDGGREHEVQRQQEERVLLTQPDRDPERSHGEEHDGYDCWIARERNRAEDRGDNPDAHESEPGWLREEETEVVVADERASDACDCESEQCEPDQRQRAASGDEREDGAERSDERGDLGGIRVLHDVGRYALGPNG